MINRVKCSTEVEKNVEGGGGREEEGGGAVISTVFVTVRRESCLGAMGWPETRLKLSCRLFA